MVNLVNICWKLNNKNLLFYVFIEYFFLGKCIIFFYCISKYFGMGYYLVDFRNMDLKMKLIN